MLHEETEKFGSRLQALTNTRLLFNTIDELEKFLGNNSIHSNGILRCFSTQGRQRSVYRDCKIEVQLRTNELFDLDWLMLNYERASRFYKSHFARTKNRETMARKVLETHFDLLSDKKLTSKNRKLAEGIVGEEVDVAILTLLLLKAIPSYDSKMGDVTDIEDQFKNVLGFLQDFTAGCGVFDVLPAVKQVEEEKYQNRLMLIYHTIGILDTYESYLNPAKIGKSHNAIKSCTAALDIAGIWTDDDSSDFWQIEPTYNTGVFFATRYSLESKSLLTLVRYTLHLLKRADGSLTAYFLHPVAMRHQLAGMVYGDQDNAWYISDYPESDAPESLSLIRTMRSECWPYSINIHKVTDPIQLEKYDYRLASSLKIDPYDKCRYNFQVSIYAITQEAVYVLDEKEDCFYRLPRYTEHEFEALTLEDNVGILEMEVTGARYLAIDERLLYIPLTARSLRRYGIDRVTEII